MPTPSIQTLRADAQQVLNLDSISAVRSVVAATLANANTGTPLNPNLTTQQLWNEFYQIVTQPKSDIESIIANQLMKFLYAPPAPGGVGANGQVIFNDGGVLAGDPQFLWNKTTNLLTVTGSATITGDLTVDTSTLKVDSTNNVVGINNASPLTGTDGGLTLGVIGSSKAMAISMFNCFARLRERDAVNNFAITTNIDTTNAVLDDNTRTSWKVRFGSGNDNFLIQRAAIGSTTFQDLYSISTTSAVWSDGAGGTRMTLNSTGLGVFNSPVAALDVYKVANDTINRTNATFCFGQIAGLGAALLGQQSASAPYQFNLQAANAANSLQFPLVLQPSGGNVGIGVTPSAWLTGVKALDIGSSALAAYSGGITHNAYFDNTDGRWEYKGTGAATFYNPQNGVHQWFVAASGTANNAITTFSSASMTLDASGNLLVGTTSLISGTADGSINIAGANSQQIVIRNTGATAGQFWRQAVDSGNTFYVLNNASTGVSITSGATSWSAVSDERLKDIIEPISNAIAKVGSLRSVIGKYKNDETNTRRSFLIAQDVLSVLPEAVDSSKSNELGLRYSEVIPLLVAAIKELTAEVNALKNA